MQDEQNKCEDENEREALEIAENNEMNSDMIKWLQEPIETGSMNEADNTVDNIVLVDKTMNGCRITKEYTPGTITETIYADNGETMQQTRTADSNDMIQTGV